ncbi:hypothetical protein HHK36_010616 [Tetracentron sinense]|uniref:BTB domain-containing protein n=1 Tax=Tetracentron sinense TaxID=13715 RepID=A0A834ZEM6_TETSI|nr:hypothetical protein HHK36_010616 [Tetracentron sinense]
MDCSICSPIPLILRPPRNTICPACYEGARSMLAFLNKLENVKGGEKSSCTLVSQPNSSKASTIFMLFFAFIFLLYFFQGIVNALKWVKEMKEIEEGLNEKLGFLGGLVVAFRDGLHTDILVKPGNNGPSIPSHRAVLAARSDIFKNMLESDGCKSPPNDTITLHELNHEELESLLEFLYSGHLPAEKVEKHMYSLSIAADKYEIPFLQKFCEHWMLGSLDSSNALDILEISDICSSKTLKETAMNFIVKNMEDIVFSTRYDAFALKNPHLSVQITRALLMEIKNKRSGV